MTEKLKEEPVEFPEIYALSYVEARQRLQGVLQELHGAGDDLEAALRLWREGRALIAHCEAFLAGALQRVKAQADADLAADTDAEHAF